ncbi:NIPSNAP family protein [Aeribacillus pallidus]|uniref:NIPSNAP family protein n=1 Tax=Aeribacillus pallidus TaxID=33936 RepID=UPI003D23EA6C
MFYRRKSYIVAPEIVESFNKHFNETLLPTQLKYGSRLIGRWMVPQTKGPVEIFAIWEYESFEEYEKIEEKVRSDQAHVERVKAWYDQHGGREHVWKHYLLEVKNEQIVSTVVKENSQAR